MMPVKLTEDMVVARSKGSDLHNIKKLNCWGSELADISVIRKLPNVEVLSLSVNQITTLADFQWCSNLQELYIRKNNIKDINELLYLRQLPKLKSLWLADNPCAQFENYRLTVLRTLPHLQKLDNVVVEGEEVQRAMVGGLLLPQGGQDSPAGAADRGSDGRSSESGGGGSLSDYSPPASTRAQRHQNGYSSPEREYVHPSAAPAQQQQHAAASRRPTQLYDDDDEDAQSSTVSPTRRVSQQQYSTPATQQSPAGQTKAGRHSIAYDNSYYQQQQQQPSSGDERASHSLPPSRRTSQQTQQYYHGQSPSRRTSHAGTPSSGGAPAAADYDSPGVEYVGDGRNGNYQQGSRDQEAGRRVSREQQYRDQGWTDDARSDVSGPYTSRREETPSSYAATSSPHSRQHTPQRDVVTPRLFTRQQYAAMLQSRVEGVNVGSLMQQHYDIAYRRPDNQADTISQRPPSEAGSRPYTSRPKTRNGNVLSAVLCLIKELDYTSLEVAEMAIRCRMDELDD